MSRDRLSTLGFRATLLNGTQGFVMTGHSAFEGFTVFQPYSTWGGLGNRVGTIIVNPVRDRYSDSAFVTSTVSVDPKVWPDRFIIDWIPSYNTPIGSLVSKEGISSGYTEGVIVATGFEFRHTLLQFQICQQILTTYSIIDGDSGGPVFGIPGFNGFIYLYGIHVGRTLDHRYAIYSPIQGIRNDLNLMWGSSC